MTNERMPVLFIGHGSPMNAIADNRHTQMLHSLDKKIPEPKAVLCISAHWLTEGTWITHTNSPKTIHDFYGFPQELFDIRYPAPSSPVVAEQIKKLITNPEIQFDDEEMWGFDHGTWSVLRHLYPKANIPVLQLSINHARPFEFHFELGKQLRSLREDGILIVGSGNIVHNLRKIVWEENAAPFSWAMEFDEWIKKKITERDFAPLMNNVSKTEAGKLSVPTTDHYIPLLYTLGASDDNDSLSFEHEGIDNGSISMRSISFGLK